MIRREMFLPEGDRVWALISQVEHAHLAADLARSWRDPLAPEETRDGPRTSAAEDELLAAIEHHDDGWAEWEEAPELDPEHGRPRSFMEMPQPDSLAIWSKSIAVAEQIGPLAAWVVAGHFSALLKIGGEARSAEADLAREWNDLMRSRRTAWLGHWTASAADHTQEVADHALQALQFFDAASLWICCTCPPEGPLTAVADDDAVLTLEGTDYRFTSRALRNAPHEAPRGTIRPWPVEGDDAQFSVDCRIVPAGGFRTTEELLQAQQPYRLTWRLRDEQRS